MFAADTEGTTFREGTGIIPFLMSELMPANTGSSKQTDAFADFPLADADQCVKCALCLPHCPTYKLSLNEGDSPRGRIALMQALTEGVITQDDASTSHLDGCLVCRACEPVCPANVPYGRLIDAGRHGLWRTGHRPGFRWKLLAFFRRTPARIRAMTSLLRLAQILRLPALFSGLRIARYAQDVGSPPRAEPHHARGGSGTVMLFLGCIARPLDHGVAHAAVRVLNAMGFSVHIPADQGCCGAMDAHAGDRDRLDELTARNNAAFTGNDTEILTTASGCGVQLQEVPELAQRVHDIMTFIAQHRARLSALDHAQVRVQVHAPCTLKNGMRENGHVLTVLQQVPGLLATPLRHQDCCGAAGTYLFEHPETADALGIRLLEALDDTPPDILVTSNTGCALHVRRLARERGLALRVLHPVQLLAECLPTENTAASE